LNSFVLNVHLYFPISSASPIFGLFSVDLVLLLVLLLTFLTIHIFITKYFSSARIRFVHSAQGWSCRTPLPALAFRTPALTLSKLIFDTAGLPFDPSIVDFISDGSSKVRPQVPACGLPNRRLRSSRYS